MDLVRCCCILFLSYSRVSRQPPSVLMVWCSRFSDLEFSHRCLTTISSLKQQQPSLGMCHPTCRKMVFPTTPKTKSHRIRRGRGNRRRQMVGGNRRRRAAAGRAKRSASNELQRALTSKSLLYCSG